jgi:hypothetical protein
MYKKILCLIFNSLFLLFSITACRSANPAANPTTIRSTPVTKSAPTYVPSTLLRSVSTSEPVEGYLNSDNRHLLWIRWHESSPGNIQGIWHVAYYNPPSKTVNNIDAPFTGTFNGKSINITIHFSPFITVSASGTLKEKDLHLTFTTGGKSLDAYGVSQATYKKLYQQFQVKHA